MNDFPQFMKNEKNRIDAKTQFTDDIEGFVYDGADGSQMAFWTCNSNKISQEHTHDFDEYMVVISGHVTMYLENKRHVLGPSDEIYIPKGTSMKLKCSAGTRTIHAFEKKRVERISSY